ncbi:hypothetical protein M0813_21381 [Anaeramoeba flamelloides]|uniref:Uncharacterized protein n=1 Tax=Anaeramoeba flamelloides TaxID=1746091 RepID=A0ABQ8YHN5_9EUKA|nr:hypothetical protein M0813_21381 [Anaeramoeba flamelloides]
MGSKHSQLNRKQIKHYLKNVEKHKNPCVVLDEEGNFVWVNYFARKIFCLKKKKKLKKLTLSQFRPATQPHILKETVPYLTNWYQTTIKRKKYREKVNWNYILDKENNNWTKILFTRVELRGIVLGQLIFKRINNPLLNKTETLEWKAEQSEGNISERPYYNNILMNVSSDYVSSFDNLNNINGFNNDNTEILDKISLIKNQFTKFLDENDLIKAKILKILEESLSQILQIHHETIDNLNSRIKRTGQRIEQEQSDSQSKIFQIENTLNRRFNGKTTEIERKKKIILENENYRDIFMKMKDILKTYGKDFIEDDNSDDSINSDGKENEGERERENDSNEKMLSDEVQDILLDISELVDRFRF